MSSKSTLLYHQLFLHQQSLPVTLSLSLHLQKQPVFLLSFKPAFFGLCVTLRFLAVWQLFDDSAAIIIEISRHISSRCEYVQQVQLAALH